MPLKHRIFTVAVEPSGEQLAAETLAAIRANRPESLFELGIIGGDILQKATGVGTAIKTDALAIHGYLDALKAYPRVKRLINSAADAIIAFEPDTVILVDSWGFTIRLAKVLKRMRPNLHIIKLVGPQVWAAREGRAKTLAQYADHVLCLLDLEPPIYEPLGLQSTVIGLPALTRAKLGNPKAVTDHYDISPQRQILLLLPGSRPSEIDRVAPALMMAAKIVTEKLPDICVIVAPTQNVRHYFMAQCKTDKIQTDFPHIVLDPSLSPYDAMETATYAMACSGTVTTELAIKQIPMLVAYKADILAYILARYFLFKPNYVTILNILENEGIIPEFLQYNQNAQNMAAEAIKMLSSPSHLLMQVRAQNRAIPRLGSIDQPAPVKAAQAIINDLEARKSASN